MLARSNLVDHASSGLKLLATTHTFNGELPAGDAGCGPDHTFTIPAGNRALDGFAAATVITNDLVLFLIKDGVVLVEADTLFSPEQFRYEPAGGVPAGDYVVRVCDFARVGAGWAAPRTYTGTLTEDDSPAPPPYLARWKVFPAQPAAAPAAGGSLEQPEHRHAPDLVLGGCPGLRPRGRQPRLARAVGPRPQAEHTDVHDQGQQRQVGDVVDRPVPAQSAAVHRRPARRGTTASRGRTTGSTDDCEPTPNGPPGSTWDDSAATVNLFVAHNRMHDWAYFLGFTEMNWNGQDYNFGLTEKFRENDPIIGNVQAGALIPGVRDNANMITLPDGIAVGHEHVLLAAVRGLVLLPMRRRRLRHARSSATSTRT